MNKLSWKVLNGGYCLDGEWRERHMAGQVDHLPRPSSRRRNEHSEYVLDGTIGWEVFQCLMSDICPEIQV